MTCCENTESTYFKKDEPRIGKAGIKTIENSHRQSTAGIHLGFSFYNKRQQGIEPDATLLFPFIVHFPSAEFILSKYIYP